MASQFVCALDECFFLYPPSWLKNPPNPASTALFKKYAANAPSGIWPRKTSTHQGFYTMTADGGFLSGKFARQSNENARRILGEGVRAWKRHVQKTGIQPKPIPKGKLELYGGEEPQAGGIKLQIAYRDLPRGETLRPGSSRFKNPYNLGWFDFSPAEARQFLTDSKEKKPVSRALFERFSRLTLKDAVRGQMSQWNEGSFRDGQLFTQLVSRSANKSTLRISGVAKLSAGNGSYSPKLHGIAVYDHSKKEFTRFSLVAAGQRQGKGGANGRETDLGPAPMGVGFQIYDPEITDG